MLKGSLAAAPASFVVLRIENPAYVWEGANDLGPVAFLGRSRSNRPVILTDKGSFELVSPRYDIDGTPAVLIVNEAKWKVVSTYPRTPDVAWVIVSPDRVAVVELASFKCISAPQMKPGLLQMRNDCHHAIAKQAQGVIREGSIWGNLDPESFGGIYLSGPAYDPLRDPKRLSELDFAPRPSGLVLTSATRIPSTGFFVAATGYEEVGD